MKMMKRTLGVGTALLAATLAVGAQADVLKIGYQKAGLPVIARQQHLIEDALKPAGVDVQWVEFSAGPPLVEALNTGAIQFVIGHTRQFLRLMRGDIAADLIELVPQIA